MKKINIRSELIKKVNDTKKLTVEKIDNMKKDGKLSRKK